MINHKTIISQIEKELEIEFLTTNLQQLAPSVFLLTLVQARDEEDYWEEISDIVYQLTEERVGITFHNNHYYVTFIDRL